MKPAKFIFIFVFCLIVAIVFQGRAATVSKTLKRIDDPVVLELKDFSPLFKTPIDRLALMVLSGDKWTPKPFQIDQKNPEGKYCFTTGADAKPDIDPTLDANDELVFMVKDSGDRAEPTAFPKGATGGMEIEITDPKDNGKGWVYLFRFQDKPVLSKDDYVRVENDAAKKRSRVITYEYVMGRPSDRIYPDEIRQVRPDGSFGEDVLDRLKMRGELVLPTGIKIPFDMDEMTKANDKGFIDGPVRVIHYSEGYMELYKVIKFKGTGHSVVSYFANHMIWPMILEVPQDSLKLIKKINFWGYMDFNAKVYGSFPFSAANPLNKNVMFDGHMTDAEKNLDTQTQIDWTAGFGPQGALVSRLLFEPKMPHLKTVPYFLDDKDIKDSPESDVGVSGVGYQFFGMETQTAIKSVCYQYYYYLSKLEPKDVNRILDIRDRPVKISVRPIEAAK